MDEIRFISATSVIGSGVDESALDQAMLARPHFVAADAGTTDAGPHSLGSGVPAFTRAAVASDLRAILRRTRPAGIPLLIGSAGTAGTDAQVDWAAEIAEEAIQAEGLGPVRMALIYAQQDHAALVRWYREGRIHSLPAAPDITEDALSSLSTVVAMAGCEPLQQSLEAGADLVIAGRCSDPALFAALPIARGFPPGLAWHAGKVVECGTIACETFGPGVLAVTLTADDFTVRPVGEDLRCTPLSIAAHSLYETADPYLFTESTGTLDISDTHFADVDGTSVRVSGSRFIPGRRPTVKLEGTTLRGYQSFIVGGIRDPLIIADLDDWLEEVARRTHHRVRGLTGPHGVADDYELHFHIYGRDAVMGPVDPQRDHPPHEVGIVASVTAPEAEQARTVMNMARQPLLHTPVPRWSGAVTGFACLHNPAVMDRGAVYDFALNHVAELDNPGDAFRTTMVVVK